MNDQDHKFLEGQFQQFKENIAPVIQNEVRKLIEEQRERCRNEFEMLHKRINETKKTNKTAAFMGGVVTNITIWGSYLIYRLFSR